jgi:uncharacterized protein YbaR (Trm112 family)
MIPERLLKIVCCPESRQALSPAEAALVRSLNDRIAAGQVKNRAGKPVSTPLDEGLLRADGKFLYPVRGNIPVLLIDEAIPLQP